MMSRTKSLSAKALTLAAALALTPVGAVAQGLFAPVVQVGDRVVTAWEVEQRARFLSLLRAPGDPRDEALKRLIEEKVQLSAGRSLGVTVAAEQIAAGQEEFAGRVNLSAADFITVLEQNGIARETFRDFIIAGVIWRETVRMRFGSRVRITEAEIDRALSDVQPRPTGLRFLFSEIIIPARDADETDQALALARQIGRNPGFDGFSDFARAYSASPSGAQGGRVDWVSIGNIPPQLVQILLPLAPGQVSPPIPIENAIALFQLRAVDDAAQPVPATLNVDYAVLRIPGGRSPEALARAAEIDARTDGCNDLYPLVRGGSPELLERVTRPLSQIPADVAVALAPLDPGEISTALTRGGDLAVVMLCSRTVGLPEGVTRNDIRNQLLNERLAATADAYLAELMSEAIIRTP